MPTTDSARRTPYYRLYEKAKRLFWDPASVDIARDLDDWRRFRPGGDLAVEEIDRQVLLLLRLFYVGEVAVATTLAPFVSAVGRLGLGLDKEFCLATQLFEEAKHADFFGRYFAEVLGDARPDQDATGQDYVEAYRRVLREGLDRVAARLRREEDPVRLEEALVEGLAHYMGVVESMLARTGYRSVVEGLGGRGLLPGLREGFRLVQRDEGRHVSFGLHLLRELTQRNPAHRERARETFERLLPDAVAIIEINNRWEHPLVRTEPMVAYGTKAANQFLAMIGAEALSEIDVEDLEEEVREAL